MSRPSVLAALMLSTTSNLEGRLAVCVAKACPVTQEAAGSYVFAPWKHCRNRVAHREPHDLVAPAVEERIAGHKETADPLLGGGRERCFEVTVGTYLEHPDLLSELVTSRQHHVLLGSLAGRI